MRRPYSLSVLLFIAFTLTLASCGLIPNLGCDVKITNQYIESTCGLFNGVRFEELEIDSFYEDKSPKIFRVVVAFKGRLDESKTKDLDRIYFNDSSGKYIWRTDTTTHWLYHKWGVHKELIDIDKKALPDTSNEIVISRDSVINFSSMSSIDLEKYNSEQYYICPIKFKADTWYYLNFYDQRYEAYLYVGNDMNLKISKIDLPTNF